MFLFNAPLKDKKTSKVTERKSKSEATGRKYWTEVDYRMCSHLYDRNIKTQGITTAETSIIKPVGFC